MWRRLAESSAAAGRLFTSTLASAPTARRRSRRRATNAPGQAQRRASVPRASASTKSPASTGHRDGAEFGYRRREEPDHQHGNGRVAKREHQYGGRGRRGHPTPTRSGGSSSPARPRRAANAARRRRS